MLGVTVEWYGVIPDKDKDSFEKKLRAVIPDVAIDFKHY